MAVVKFTTRLSTFIALILFASESFGGIVVSTNDITVTQGQAGLNAYAFQVDVTSDAGEIIQNMQVDFGIGAGDGSLGISITPPSAAFGPDWVGTVWDSNESPGFNASDTDALNNDLSQLQVLNGIFVPGPFFFQPIDLPDAPTTGVFANYAMDISGLAPGVYVMDLNINGGTNATAFGGGSLAITGGTALLTVEPVPEPSSFAALGLMGVGYLAVRRRRKSQASAV